MGITFAADMRAHEGYIIEDEALKQYGLTQEAVDNYNNALEAVKNATYKGAEAVLYDEHVAAIDNMHNAIDNLVVAASEISEVVVVADMAEKADTTPEQQELQDYVTVNDVSLTTEKVDNFNDSLAEVEVFAQQAGAYLAAATNEEVTGAIDSFAQQNNIAVSSYTAISYTQSMDDLYITFADGYAIGFVGYFIDKTLTAGDLYNDMQIYQNNETVVR